MSNLSQPFNSFSNNIDKLDKSLSNYTESLKKLNTQNQEFISNNDAAGNKVSEIATSFTALDTILKIIGVNIKGFSAALTGGLSVVIAFLPELIKITKEFFNGNQTISEWAQNFKSLSGVMKSANTDATEQTTKLNLLYRAATGVNTAGQERLKYAQQLKETYPEQFKNFDKEQIANGKAKTAYTDLAKSILASAKAKAALNKMSEEPNTQLRNFMRLPNPTYQGFFA